MWIMGKVKYKAISGRLSDDFGFNVSDDGSVLPVENVYCMNIGLCVIIWLFEYMCFIN